MNRPWSGPAGGWPTAPSCCRSSTFFLLTPPILSIFNAPALVFGIPLLHVYCFAVWLIAIACGGWLAEPHDRRRRGDRRRGGAGRAELTVVVSSTAVVVVALAYLGVLFAIAWYGDRRAKRGRSLIRSPLVYTLSLGVYCTSWTFYGAVGTAARRGVEFITIYTGPTIVFLGWWFLLRKIARISKSQRITSIADFIASRYGKSALLGMLVTVIAMVGTMPYIALQLKAVSTSFAVLVNYTLYADINGTLAGTAAEHPRRRRLPHRDRHGDLRHPVRHPPHRRQRAPRGHGRGHRLRILRQVPRLPGGRHLRGGRLRPGHRRGRGEAGAGARATSCCCRKATRRAS